MELKKEKGANIHENLGGTPEQDTGILKMLYHYNPKKGQIVNNSSSRTISATGLTI